MAIVSISLKDETFEKYSTYSPEDPRKGIETQLERFKGIPPSERALIFNSEDRGEIEKLFGRPIEAAAELVKWVKRLQEVNVGGIDIPLTEPQVKKLESDARFFGEKAETMLPRKARTALRDAIGA